MTEQWRPPLRVREVGGICRLWLGGYLYGDGRTLQEAGDELVARVRELAVHLHAGAGLRVSTEVGPPDFQWLDFLHRLGEVAAAGEDVRSWVLRGGAS